MLAEDKWQPVGKKSWTEIAEPESHMVKEVESSSAGWMVGKVKVRVAVG